MAEGNCIEPSIQNSCRDAGPPSVKNIKRQREDSIGSPSIECRNDDRRNVSSLLPQRDSAAYLRHESIHVLDKLLFGGCGRLHHVADLQLQRLIQRLACRVLHDDHQREVSGFPERSALKPTGKNAALFRELSDAKFGIWSHWGPQSVPMYGDWYAGNGFRLSPHLGLRYSPVRQIEIRLDGGRRLRFVNPLEDNFDVFLTGKVFSGNFMDHTLEDAWDFNGSLKYQLPFGATDDAYVSVGYSRTSFSQQVIVDYERALNTISFYNLDGRRSYTDSFLAELHVVPFRRFIVTGMFRYSDPKVELAGRGLVTRPMVPLYGGELDLRYSTLRDMWIFDLRASVNGPCRVYDFMRNHRDADGNLMYADGRTPVYPALSVRIRQSPVTLPRGKDTRIVYCRNPSAEAESAPTPRSSARNTLRANDLHLFNREHGVIDRNVFSDITHLDPGRVAPLLDQLHHTYHPGSGINPQAHPVKELSHFFPLRTQLGEPLALLDIHLHREIFRIRQAPSRHAVQHDPGDLLEHPARLDIDHVRLVRRAHHHPIAIQDERISIGRRIFPTQRMATLVIHLPLGSHRGLEERQVLHLRKVALKRRDLRGGGPRPLDHFRTLGDTHRLLGQRAAHRPQEASH